MKIKKSMILEPKRARVYILFDMDSRGFTYWKCRECGRRYQENHSKCAECGSKAIIPESSIRYYAKSIGVSDITIAAILRGELFLPVTRAGMGTLSKLGLELAYRVIKTGKILRLSEVPQYLHDQAKHWGTITAYVSHYKLNRNQFDFVLHGKRPPTRKMLPTLGWEIVYLIKGYEDEQEHGNTSKKD